VRKLLDAARTCPLKKLREKAAATIKCNVWTVLPCISSTSTSLLATGSRPRAALARRSHISVIMPCCLRICSLPAANDATSWKKERGGGEEKQKKKGGMAGGVGFTQGQVRD